MWHTNNDIFDVCYKEKEILRKKQLILEIYIAQIVERLNQRMRAFLLHLLHCNVSMLEISLVEIDRMPRERKKQLELLE